MEFAKEDFPNLELGKEELTCGIDIINKFGEFTFLCDDFLLWAKLNEPKFYDHIKTYFGNQLYNTLNVNEIDNKQDLLDCSALVIIDLLMLCFNFTEYYFNEHTAKETNMNNLTLLRQAVEFLHGIKLDPSCNFYAVYKTILDCVDKFV